MLGSYLTATKGDGMVLDSTAQPQCYKSVQPDFSVYPGGYRAWMNRDPANDNKPQPHQHQQQPQPQHHYNLNYHYHEHQKLLQQNQQHQQNSMQVDNVNNTHPHEQLVIPVHAPFVNANPFALSNSINIVTANYGVVVTGSGGLIKRKCADMLLDEDDDAVVEVTKMQKVNNTG
ncbi:hypothetical protein BDR26DRAFT_864212 [Obelidium mucronatum]|nr:hypothetical protein BDR26DRAFT_864212 [Obelidium mucronatum]